MCKLFSGLWPSIPICMILFLLYKINLFHLFHIKWNIPALSRRILKPKTKFLKWHFMSKKKLQLLLQTFAYQLTTKCFAFQIVFSLRLNVCWGSGVKLCSTHKYEIPSGGICQIDVLEVGKITYEDPSLLVVFVKTTFAHQIRW